jgi:micrococcal nuclease
MNNILKVLIVMLILLVLINYSFLDKKITGYLILGETGFVERIIDGDTIVINGNSTRLLGVNTPEKGEKYSEDAKEYLEEEILNKTVVLKFTEQRKDLYNRDLAYVFINNKNINLELVRRGFANFYFPSKKDAYYLEFKSAWDECLNSNINLCKKSTHKCAECIVLEEFDYKSEKIILYNKCNFDCNLDSWMIKDEGRKNYIFSKIVLNQNNRITIKTGKGENTENILYWNHKSYIWTKTGDTLFLRDNNGELVLWENY